MAISTFLVAGKKVNAVTDDAYFAEQWESAQKGEYEPSTYEVFNKYIDQKTVYFDLGAYIGYTCLYASQLAKTAFAFEPDPVAFKLLEANIKANDHISNLQIFPYAAGTEEKMISIKSSDSGGNAGSSLLLNDFKSSWQVKMVDINQFIADRVSDEKVFIKIDIEGYEYTLLKMIGSTLQNYKPILFIALHPQILANTISGQSLIKKITRRTKLIKEHLSLFSALAKAKEVKRSNGTSVSFNQLLLQLLRKGNLEEENKELLLFF